MYYVLKDFAGPIATICVALVAGYITWSYNQNQARMALDKLKIDLLGRRYEIYQAAKDLCTFVLFADALRAGDLGKFQAFEIQIDEARFFYSKDVQEHLDGL